MLALVQPWGRVLPRWLLHPVAWGVSSLCMLYGGALFVQHGLMVAGVIPIPPGLGATAARWHLVLWDPWWLLGGVLLLAAAWSTRPHPTTDPTTPPRPHPGAEGRGRVRDTTPGGSRIARSPTWFVAAPTLLFGYGVVRLVDGRDGAYGPGLAWTIGHLLFLAGLVMFG